MNLVLHPITKQKYDNYISNPPQVVLLVSASGSGKQTLLTQMALDILGTNPAGRLFELTTLPDKKSISIDSVRTLKNSLRLKSNKKRVILINNAGLLTTEAQNSLLKILEEPPTNVHFLLGIDNLNEVLETIRSRSSIWHLTLPSKEQIKESLKSYNDKEVNNALAIADNRVGLVYSLLDKTKEHELLSYVNSAKELLAEPHFKRLITANQLSKDNNHTKNILEALVLVCHAALRHSALNNSANTIRWQKRLANTLQAQDWLSKNIQPKLVLSYLFIVL